MAAKTVDVEVEILVSSVVRRTVTISTDRFEADPEYGYDEEEIADAATTAALEEWDKNTDSSKALAALTAEDVVVENVDVTTAGNKFHNTMAVLNVSR